MNIFDQILIDSQAERVRRQAKRREQMRILNDSLPKPNPPQDGVKQAVEWREYINNKIRSLLND